MFSEKWPVKSWDSEAEGRVGICSVFVVAVIFFFEENCVPLVLSVLLKYLVKANRVY